MHMINMILIRDFFMNMRLILAVGLVVLAVVVELVLMMDYWCGSKPHLRSLPTDMHGSV